MYCKITEGVYSLLQVKVERLEIRLSAIQRFYAIQVLQRV